MLRKKGLEIFASARRLKATLTELQKKYKDADIQSVIIRLDLFLSLEEKVKNMNRAEITKKVEQKMLERGKEVKSGIALLMGRAEEKGMSTQLISLMKELEGNISA